MAIRIVFRTRRSEKQETVFLSPHDERFLGTNGDIVFTGNDVLSRHARLFAQNGSVRIEPLDGALLAINGKPVNGATALENGDWLALGQVFVRVGVSTGITTNPSTGISSGVAKPRPQGVSSYLREGRVITIGRLDTCDLAIPSPLVSRHHANLRCEEGRVVLKDLNSTNGTFVNGKRVIEPVVLERGDRVVVAAFTFLFTGTALEPADDGGVIEVEARGVSKTVRDRATGKPRQLLDDINLTFKSGEFAAVFGSSGSGKSTLLDALNGRRPATSGKVLYNGIDFYASFDAFRSAIGYVPQQDIVHRGIPLHRALRYTARLRLPRDTSTDEIEEHIERVLYLVGLGDKAGCPIDTPSPLSGGQLKRVSLAVELIANPKVLFLDEVTSGLDAGTDKKMMQLFSTLASGRKTVICVTHSLENIDACHLVVLLHQGKLVYFGSPREALDHFAVSRLSDVYDLLDSRPVEHWAEQYLQSPSYDEYIVGRSSASLPPQPRQGNGQPLSLLSSSRRGNWTQLTTLTRRYLDLMQSDRLNLTFLLLQAPLVATLIGLVFSASGPPSAARAMAESNIAFVLVLSAIWCGCLNSTREVVKELPIYLRERTVNLGIGPYLLSKLIPLAALCLVQSVALLGPATLLLSWNGDFWRRLAILFLSSMAAAGMGLSVSTLVSSNDKAVALVPILLIPQVIFSGAIVTLGKTGETIARFTMISFSAFDAMKTTMSSELAPFLPAQRTLPESLGMIGMLFAIFSLAAAWGLRLKDSRR